MCVLQAQSTPLHYAADNNKLNCVKLLCDKGASLDAKNIVSLYSVMMLYVCKMCLFNNYVYHCILNWIFKLGYFVFNIMNVAHTLRTNIVQYNMLCFLKKCFY